METHPKYDEAIYQRIGYDELLNLAASLLRESNQEVTFENLVAMCFETFPKRFALRGYPQWPDSAIVNKSWLRCRSDKKYLTGTVKDGFALTARGSEMAASTHKTLTGQRPIRPKLRRALTEDRTREGRLLRSIEQSRPYREYQKRGTLGGMTDYDVCDLLLCTLESSPKTRDSGYEAFRHAAQSYGKPEILKFLMEIRRKFLHLFAGTPSKGMVRRK